MGKKNSNTLVKNASFLMVAALISKIIGMIYKSPLSSLLGRESFACFQFAQNVYFILLMIASFSIPQAVSKIMSERIAFKRYRDAQRVFKGALLYAVIAGGIVALICVFGASILVPDSVANARLALQMLAPTVFISGILGVFRGYFQAYRNMMPTSISQIVEQIAVAVVALLMANFMVNHFAGAGEDTLQRWSAAGATIGTGAGVTAALLFMLFVYSVNRKTINRRIARDKVSVDESYQQVMRNIVLIVAPIILSAFIYNVNGYINGVMYTSISDFRGMDNSQVKVLYAEFGFFMTLINIPLTLASTAPTSMIPEVSAHYATGDVKGAIEKISNATWISMLISMPASVGLAVLAKPVTSLLFPSTEGVAGQLMVLGVITVILNSTSNISNGVLQGIGRANVPMINAAISLAVDVVFLAVLLFFTNTGIYAVVIAMIVYAVVMCVLNDRALKKYLGYQNPWKYAYLPPLLATIPMGAVAFAVYKGVRFLTKSLPYSNLLALIPSIALAAAVYFVAYLFIAKPSRQELLSLPGGTKLAVLAQKLKII
ncbi:putative polysaccharide biosynthesis protein [Blautia producta]|uniref:Polysaccharide biosynthesis protein n=2 Tax=Blautia producta TaxID=33035 RepID=A0A7G5MT75_9FIRM|nr:polysaccharide biosynthesis protein [Blautia producta]QIB58383.1 polysaccharide biosynthesis protein [Blautia producta ATCC 27340 = DSM 2950]QMW77818.1 polysaccharide biosynthesis protein [Blautia producta]